MAPLLSLPRVRLPGRHRDASPVADAVGPGATTDAVLVFSRVEAERLSTWLDRADAAGSRNHVPLASPGVCTPERLRRAIADRVAADGGDGRVEVLRLPAALTTPEAWEIRLGGVLPSTVAGLEEGAGRHRRHEPDHAD